MAGDGTFAGSDFDDRARAQVAESCDDSLDGLLIAEEVLSELWFTGHVLDLGISIQGSRFGVSGGCGGRSRLGGLGWATQLI